MPDIDHHSMIQATLMKMYEPMQSQYDTQQGGNPSNLPTAPHLLNQPTVCLSPRVKSSALPGGSVTKCQLYPLQTCITKEVELVCVHYASDIVSL